MNGGLRRVICRLPLWPINDESRDGPYINDYAAAPSHHLLTDDLAAVPNTVKIDPHNLVPLLRGDLQRGPMDASPSIVDQNIHRPESRRHSLQHPVHIFPICDIQRCLLYT